MITQSSKAGDMLKKVWLCALAGLALAVVLGAALIGGGLFDVAADSPHGDAVFRLMEIARDHAVLRQAAAIVPPADLSDTDRIRRGAGNYDAMCVNCHLSPGVEDSEIRKGLYPKPPSLASASGRTEKAQVDAQRFWTIKHGIKASGMASWSKGGLQDGDIWDLTAFLRILPNLSASEYRDLVEASEGHSHMGVEGHRSEPLTAHEHAHTHEASHDSHRQSDHHD